MHRDHWLRLRGYPEWKACSMSIDGFLCYAAHSDGLHETVLRDPHRIYHIEHGLGSGWPPEGERHPYERITSKGIPWIGRDETLKYARRTCRKGPLIFNVVCADNTIEQAFDVDATLREVLPALRPNGTLVAARPPDGLNPDRTCDNHTWKTTPLRRAHASRRRVSWISISRSVTPTGRWGCPPIPPPET